MIVGALFDVFLILFTVFVGKIFCQGREEGGGRTVSSVYTSTTDIPPSILLLHQPPPFFSSFFSLTGVLRCTLGPLSLCSSFSSAPWSLTSMCQLSTTNGRGVDNGVGQRHLFFSRDTTTTHRVKERSREQQLGQLTRSFWADTFSLNGRDLGQQKKKEINR